MIIDDAIAAGHGHYHHKHLSRAQWERLVNARKRAESFVFSDEASSLMGRFASECGELILRHRQFAVPPFHDTYIEVNVRRFVSWFKTAGPPGDHRIGYLITGDHVFICVSAFKPDDDPVFSPIYYTLAPPGERARWDTKQWGNPIAWDEPEHRASERSPQYIRLSYIPATAEQIANAQWNHLVIGLGSTAQRIHDEEERLSLLYEFQPHYQGPKTAAHLTSDQLQRLLQDGAGEIRNLWTALLWLNRPVHTTITNIPPTRRIMSGRTVVYKAHRTVEIDLHKHRSLRRAFTLSGPRLSPRRHHVRGAFHHSGGTFACSHDWPLRPDVDGHWQCHHCGRLRWWVKDHVRGDATRGWVQHDYAVNVGETL